MKPCFRLALAAALLAAAAPIRGEPLDASPFDFRVPIAVSGYAGAAPLTNFPVLVALSADSPAGFRYSDCAADGSDLRFADADGNLLPHEVDTWNAAGESLVWVGLPVLTNGAAFTMYYGSAHPGPASAQNLWSLAGYAGVWHLTDGHDSTTNGLDGTLVAGISAAADSKLGGALDFDTAKMSVGTTPNGDLASGFSLEAWCHARRLTDKNGKTNGGNALFGKNLTMSVRVQGSGIQLTTPGVLDHPGANCAIAANQWFHLGLTFKPNTATSGKTTVADQYKVYRDGVQKASLGASRIPNLANSSEMWLGGNQWSEQDFDGILDEFRLSYSIRSADWLKAAFDTAAAPASFVTLGPAEPTDQSAPSFGAAPPRSSRSDRPSRPTRAHPPWARSPSRPRTDRSPSPSSSTGTSPRPSSARSTERTTRWRRRTPRFPRRTPPSSPGSPPGRTRRRSGRPPRTGRSFPCPARTRSTPARSP